MKTVLIISNTGDIHCDSLIEACNRLGIIYFRWNTDRFRLSGDIVWDICSNSGVLEIDGHRCKLAEIDLLIYRRPVATHCLRKDIEPWIGTLLDQEWKTIENALSIAVRGKVINSVHGMALARNKIIQLQTAKNIGLNVPKTLISSDIKKLKAFAGRHNCVTKGIDSSFNLNNGLLRSGMTSRISLSDLEDYNSNGCPTLLQQEIIPKAIWRIITIEKKVFGFRLVGSELKDEVDSRKVESLLECTSLPVPENIAEQLIAMCQKLSILYASSDIIEDQDGCMWFLDLNPEGQWGYYEDNCKVCISDELIKLSGIE